MAAASASPTHKSESFSILPLLQEVKQCDSPPPFASQLNVPQLLLNIEKPTLEDYDVLLLSAESPLFAKLRGLIEKINAFVTSHPTSPLRATLTKISRHYATYIEAVCAAQGSKRRELLKKPASPNPDVLGDIYLRFLKAYETNHSIGQISALEEMAAEKQKESILQAAHLLNSALAVAKKSTPKHKERLAFKLQELEILFLKKTFKIEPSTRGRSSIMVYRQRLANIRKKVGTGLKKDVDILKIQKYLTEEYKTLLCELILDSIHLMQKEPPCSFAVLGLGSMARGEMCPYSDVEFAFLTAEESPEVLEYFRNLSRFLELRFANFGETKWDIIRPQRMADGSMREAISLTPGGFSMDIGGLSPLGKAGVYELIGTPQTLAAYQDPSWLNRNEGELIMVNALTQTSLVMGDSKLYQTYKKETTHFLDFQKDGILGRFGGTKLRESRALHLLRGHLQEFKPYLTEDRITMRAFDIKRDFYRPLQMAIGSILLYYGLSNHSTFVALKQLKEKGVIGEEGNTRLIKTLRVLLILRVRAHLFYQKEKEILYRRRGKDDSGSAGLFLMRKEETQVVLEIYRTLIPLHKEMQLFVKNPEKSLREASFYDKAVGTATQQDEDDLNYEAAASAYEQVAALNPEDSEALHNLQRIKMTLGEAKKAITYNEDRLRILREKHGDEPHSEIAMTLQNIGYALEASGKPEEALDLYSESLKMHELIYGGLPHILTAALIHNIGYASEALGKLNQALEFYGKAHKMFKAIYGNRPHPHLAASIHNVGTALEALGRPSEALKFYLQALNIRRAVYGDRPHPDVATSISDIGAALQDLGETKEALNYYLQALHMRQSVYGDRPHPDIAASFHEIGSAWQNLGNIEQALKFYHQSLKVKKEVHGDQPHYAVAASLNNIGTAYQLLGDPRKGIDFYLEAFEILRVIYGDDCPHSNIAFTLNNIGTAWQALGKVGQALVYYQQAFRIRKTIYGDQPHPEMATTLYTIGSAYTESGKPTEALHFYEQALAMFKAIYCDHPHPNMLYALSGIALSYNTLGNQKEAVHYGEEAHKMLAQVFEASDPAHKRFKERLDKCLQMTSSKKPE